MLPPLASDYIWQCTSVFERARHEERSSSDAHGRRETERAKIYKKEPICALPGWRTMRRTMVAVGVGAYVDKARWRERDASVSGGVKCTD